MALITIMIPLYNEEKYILETLKSIQNQSFKNFVCLISDNNSSDSSSQICKDFIKDDKRFKLYTQESNIGSIPNVEFLITKIETKYTMLFAGHDVIEREFLSLLLEIIENDDEVSLVFSKALGIDELSQTIENEFMKQEYDFRGNSLSRYIQSVRELANCTIVQGIFRSEIFETFKLTCNTTCVDHILLSHLMWKGKLYIVDEMLYKRRFFKQRETTPEERISGKGKEISLSYNICYKAYLEDFNSLYSGPDEFRTFLNSKILDILTQRFGISHLYVDDK